MSVRQQRKTDDDEVKSRKNAAENYDAINAFHEVRPFDTTLFSVSF